jgi:DNA-binding beta-propeller fold protein YncE
MESSSAPSLILSALILGIGTLYWFFARSRRRKQEEAEYESGTGMLTVTGLFGFVPSLIWWFVLTIAVYSYAGEKMPWLSTHFVIPTALLSGWYFGEKLRNSRRRFLLSSPALGLFGLTVVLLVAAMLALGPLLLGKITFGGQELENLKGIGRFLGSLAAVGVTYFFWRRYYINSEPAIRRNMIILGVFALLSLLTVRFTYMASFPNADSAREFLVYAHGAPATKEIVMQQVEELSMRLHGDKSIKVAFSRDTSWPFTWYLRDYPNRVFYGDNPSQSLKESPIIITGNLDWAKTEPYLGNDYEQATYTYLWWPMEEYRKISWGAILGDPNALERRGLANPDVRQALWDIFFYRDFEKYGQVFGGTYTPGQWPLRHEMRLYIRRDVLATLWDRGISVANARSFEDPYAEKALQLSPVMVLNESGTGGAGDGEFLAPRNVAIGPDQRIFVADSGNHRIQVFDRDGTFLFGWGGPGAGAGQFNEPWGIEVDESYVYVADTWNHRIQKFMLDGTFVNAFGQSGSPAEGDDGLGLFFGPRDIAFLDNGQLLVTDTGNHRMQILDPEGNFIREVGEFGNLLGQLNEPVGLAVSPDGSIFLADTWNNRIQRFSPQLLPLNDWQVSAWKGQSTNNKPYLDTDSAGRVFVSDPEGYRVLIFSSLGDYLGRFGEFGVEVNSLGLPNGIAIDQEDNLFVADAGNNRVLKFAPVFAISQVEPAEEPAGILGGEGPFAGEPDQQDGSDSLDLPPSPSGQEEAGNGEAMPVETP